MRLRTITAVAPGALLVWAVVLLGPGVGAQRGDRVGQPAPEISGGPWINTEPLSMGELRGRVVFLEFWTYG